MAIAGTNEFSNRYSTYVENSDRKPVGSDENNVQQRTALKFPMTHFEWQSFVHLLNEDKYIY